MHSYESGPYPINQDKGFTSKVRCCFNSQYKFDPSTSYTISSAIRRPMHLDMPCLPRDFLNVSNQTTTEASGWRYSEDISPAAIEERVANEPGGVEAWLELALLRINFDLICTDINARNEGHLQQILLWLHCGLSKEAYFYHFCILVIWGLKQCIAHDTLMGSTSIDHSLINSVVEIIISKEPGVTKEVAMIVEALMETFPENHELLLQIRRIFIDNLDKVTNMAAAVWISSLLFASLLQASPHACEQCWVEAGRLREQLQDEDSLRSFYQFALILHPSQPA